MLNNIYTYELFYVMKTQTNDKIIQKIKEKINKYLEGQYVQEYECKNFEQYIDLFDNILIDTDDIVKASFILPNGKLKIIKIDINNLQLNNYLADFLCDIKENIDELIKFEHFQIKFLGFDLEKIIQCGCVRVGTQDGKEYYLHMDLSHKKPNNKILQTIEYILINAERLFISFNYKDDNFSFYSIKNGNTISDIKKDINIKYKLQHNI